MSHSLLFWTYCYLLLLPLTALGQSNPLSSPRSSNSYIALKNFGTRNEQKRLLNTDFLDEKEARYAELYGPRLGLAVQEHDSSAVGYFQGIQLIQLRAFRLTGTVAEVSSTTESTFRHLESSGWTRITVPAQLEAEFSVVLQTVPDGYLFVYSLPILENTTQTEPEHLVVLVNIVGTLNQSPSLRAIGQVLNIEELSVAPF